MIMREAFAVSVPHDGVVPFFLMVQESTLVAFHETFVVLPLLTRSGVALIEAVEGRTVTVAVSV